MEHHIACAEERLLLVQLYDGRQVVNLLLPSVVDAIDRALVRLDCVGVQQDVVQETAVEQSQTVPQYLVDPFDVERVRATVSTDNQCGLSYREQKAKSVEEADHVIMKIHKRSRCERG
jgi:hypothetical protein